MRVLQCILLLVGMLGTFSSCKDDTADILGGIETDPGDSPTTDPSDSPPEKKKISLLSSCQNWGSANICLLTEGTGSGTSATPTLTFKGLDKINGNVRLFSDSGCLTVLGSPVAVNVATVEVTTPAQSTFRAEYYAQYTHTDNSISPCLGPVAWTVEESPTLAFESSAFSIPTFTLSGMNVQAGSVGLFSDSACTVAISDPMDANSDTHRIIAHALTSYGNFEYYARHTDATGQVGDCVGPVSYNFVSGLQETDPVLALDSGNDARDDDSTPTISLIALEFESGKIQLFSDESCTTAASDEADYIYSSSGTTITANALGTFGSTNYWAKITESIENQSRCMGPVAYEYVPSVQLETLTLALSSPSTSPALDSTPTLSVGGIDFRTGTVQLFSDPSCATAASGAVAASSTSVSITANALTGSSHQFYVQHTDTDSNKGNCTGPVAYTLETLVLALTSPSVGWGSDDTPTFSVSGLTIQNGTVQLFSDSACATSASGTVTVSSGTASITANTLTAGNHNFYVQHTDSNSNAGDCFGPVAYSMEVLTLALSSPATSPALDSTPTLSVSGLLFHNGTAKLFSDSACTSVVSGGVAASSGTVSITANALSGVNHNFYVQHMDSNSNKGNCYGPIAYTMETPRLALSSSNTALDSDPTPTFTVTGLLIHSGTVQLFSNSACSTMASAKVAVTSGTASITANALTVGSHRFYVRHTDGNGNEGICGGTVNYRMETLSLAFDAPNTPVLDYTPTFEVTGLTFHNGTIQLFSDSICTTVASGAVSVTSGTALITANSLTVGGHNFYVQHTDSSGNEGDCTGPVVYSVEALTLALSSSNIPLDSDPTPTLNVTGLLVHNGTVRLFSDSACTSAASGTVTVSSGTSSITANALTSGKYQFYVRHTDSSGNRRDCFGPVAYSMEPLTLVLSSPSSALGTDSTPTFVASGFVARNGLAQLFSDSACSASSSGTVAVSSASASITANALTSGNYQFYVRHTDSNGNRGDCFGPVVYSMETLTLTLSLNNFLDSDPNPSLTVTGLVLHNGTVQLFSDSSCSTAASDTVNVSAATASISASTLDDGIHQFYVRHMGANGNLGGCFGPVAYTMETLALVLLDPSTQLGHDSTPTLSVSGFVNNNGSVQLFSNSDCATASSDVVTVSSGTVSLVANAVTPGEHNFYVQHTDGNNNQGDCQGPTPYEYHKIATAISMGSNHACAILDDKSLKCWGRNEYGQLGDGTTVDKYTPTAVDLGTGRTAKAVSAGAEGTCAILDDDSLKCWGKNYWGGTHGNTPTLWSNSNNIKAISRNGCVILATNGEENAVLCGSVRSNGQSLGYALLSANMISSAGDRTCIIETSNSIRCWRGWNFIQNPGISAKAISISNNTACAISMTDSVVCRGFHSSSTASTIDLGNGRTAKAISTGSYHACAILDNDSIKCWGSNFSGQLGDETTSDRDTPVAVNLGTNRTVKAISAYGNNTCAILDDDSLKCWGRNYHGELADGMTSNRPANGSVSLGQNKTATSVSIGNGYTCAILNDDSLKCWGYHGYGFGDGSTGRKNIPTLIYFGDERTVESVGISNSEHTCVLLDDDSVKCWGNNQYGQLGDSSTDHRTTPVGPNLGDSDVVSTIKIGGQQTCAILNDNSLKCWGIYGGNVPASVDLGDGRTVNTLELGYQLNICVVLDDGSLKCWGDNTYGQLGTGDSSDTPVAISLGQDRTVVDIRLGDRYICAILDDDSLKCWGKNDDGQVGNGSTISSNTPVAVNLGTDKSAKAIDIGTRHTCVILNDNSLKCWGYNNRGQVGNGNETDQTTPITIGLGMGRTAKAIGLGSRHTCAILDNDSVKCWGAYHGGNTPTAVDLGNNRTAKSIVTGDGHSCAILNDDSLRCWGINEYGQLGIPTWYRGDDPGEMGDNLPVVNLD